MDAVGWAIRDNEFRNIQGRTRQGRGAIFIWFESQDVTIERNRNTDCDQGIAIGNAHITEGTPLHAERFLIRDNTITRAPMNPVFLAHTRDVRFIENTIDDPDNARGRSIRVFHANPGLQVIGNRIHGPPIREESVKGDIVIRDNIHP
jgi:hypothetical protein